MQRTVPKLVTITETAANKIKEYTAMENEQYLGLRLSVESSSCSCCTSYDLALGNSLSESDVVVEEKGVKIILSKKDTKYLKGSQIDYIEGLQRSGFKINNPNNLSSCGCG
ncbi:MAG: iron-sulfur cluster assembly accessory protein [Nitrososphaerales archaeon]|nr:iron-sulfur cluster assembly accessory protein [Nitrososphaerales archaeon]